MSEQLELDFGDEYDLLFLMEKRELIDRILQLETIFFSQLRNITLQGEINRAVMQVWKLINKDGDVGASTYEELYASIEYAVKKIKEMQS